MKNQDDIQTVDVFEASPKKHGGSRAGSGRPKLPETISMRVPVSMVETIKMMVAATKAGHYVEYRIIPNQPKQ